MRRERERERESQSVIFFCFFIILNFIRFSSIYFGHAIDKCQADISLLI